MFTIHFSLISLSCQGNNAISDCSLGCGLKYLIILLICSFINFWKKNSCSNSRLGDLKQ